MRLVLIGTEYAGKTTLVDALYAWGESKGIHFHLDDHFSIPDQFFLTKEEREAMLRMPPVIQERFQRFQIYYHIHVAADYEDCLLAGFHIEEAIYGGRYYYPGKAWAPYGRKIETSLPSDTILLLLSASPDVIRKRMTTSPHEYPVVPPGDVEEINKAFQAEYAASWIPNKLHIDTSELSPEQLLPTFLKRVTPFLSTRDLLRLRAVSE
jgi:hypothetical protein